ncbi:MAG: flagellar hook-basal body complex protein FliE [Rhodoblastus sp.]|jgi:flagellar hook-basal body complex protein FliE
MIPVAIGLSVVDGLARTVEKFRTTGIGSEKPAVESEFGKVLSEIASSASHSVAAAERTSVAALNGKASAREVVESLMAAEQNLQVALAVRDKAVAALQEISRMTI